MHSVPNSASRDVIDPEAPFDRRDREDLHRLLGKLEALLAPARTAAKASSGVQSEALEQRAQEQLEGRRRRARIFGPHMFAEPAWDMLLVLYASGGGQRQTQSSLGELSGATRSTATRWIDYLSDRGLVRREAHPTDLRRNFVSLTEKGRNLLDLYLSETG